MRVSDTRVAGQARPPAGPLRRLQRVEQQVFPALAAEFAEARLELDLERAHGLAYYDGLLLAVHATGVDGARLELADGGSAPWLTRLLGDRREQLFVSGVGLERLAAQPG